MGWCAPVDRFEHVDCSLAELKLYVQMLKFPELTPTTIRHSGLVRSREMSRSEALRVESENLSNPAVPHMLHSFLEEIDMTQDEFEQSASDWEKASQFHP